MPWWEREPARLEWEVLQLRSNAIGWTEDVELKSKGILALDLEVPNPEASSQMYRAIFPDAYPWFRPEIFDTESPRLGKHQAPDGKFCLLGQSAKSWDPSRDSLAWLLTEQLPKVFRTQTEPTSDDQIDQGEPQSFYLDTSPGGVVFDGSWSVAEHDCGKFWMWEVRGSEHEAIHIMTKLVGADDVAVAEQFGKLQLPRGTGPHPWLRLDVAPLDMPANDLFKEVQTRTRLLSRPGKVDTSIVGVVFPDEVSSQGATTDAWAFVRT